MLLVTTQDRHSGQVPQPLGSRMILKFTFSRFAPYREHYMTTMYWCILPAGARFMHAWLVQVHVSCTPGWSQGCFMPSMSVRFVCTSALIKCTIITSHTLLPCDFTLVDLTAALSAGIATMSSLAQLRVWDTKAQRW